MRKTLIPIISLSLVLALGAGEAEAAVKSGTKCPKKGSTRIYNGKLYTCIKLGKNLYWDNGAKIKTAPPTTSPSPLPSTSSTLKPQSPSIPDLISNLSATWSEEDILLNFDFNPRDLNPNYIYRFLVTIHDSKTNKTHSLIAGYGYIAETILNKSSSKQILRITSEDMNKTGISLTMNIDQIGIQGCNLDSNCQTITYVAMPSYVSPFPKPIFTITNATDSYVITLDANNLESAAGLKNSIGQNLFYGASVEENTGKFSTAKEARQDSNWKKASGISTQKILSIYTPDAVPRWVRIKYVATSGNPSEFSDALLAIPKPFMS